MKKIIRFVKENRSIITRILKILLSVGMLVSFFFFIPIKELYDAIRSVDPLFFWVCLLAGFPVLYLMAVRLWFLARKQGIDFKIHQIFVINLVIKFYSFFLPASIIGSGLRWYKLSPRGKGAEALSAITVNRVLDVFFAIFFGMIWMILGIDQSGKQYVILFSALILLIAGSFALLKISPRLAGWAKSREISSKRKWVKMSFSFTSKVLDSLKVYKEFSAGELLFLIVILLFTEIIGLIGYILLARALSVPISFVDLGWMRSIFFLSALAPFTLAGGIGLREVSVVVVMSSFGISADKAAAFSFLLYARSVLLNLSGGFIELLSAFKGEKKQ